MSSEPDFAALGAAVLARRTELGLSQSDVAGAGGPSDTTQGKIEAGNWFASRPHGTLKALDRGLQWEPGTAARILAGGSVGGRTHTGDHVRLTGEEADSGVSNADLLREIVAMREALERLAGGQSGAEPVDGADGPA